MNISHLLLAATVAVGALAACGKKDAPAPASAPAPAPVAAAPTANLELGKSVYGKACALCHAAGVGGAPKPGDKADWGPRVAQGIEVLHKHALEGFTGQKGQMPAKGGNAALSDDEVKAAIAYMVAQ